MRFVLSAVGRAVGSVYLTRALVSSGEYMYVGHPWPPWVASKCLPGNVVKILERFAGETWSPATRGLARPDSTGVGSLQGHWAKRNLRGRIRRKEDSMYGQRFAVGRVRGAVN